MILVYCRNHKMVSTYFAFIVRVVLYRVRRVSRAANGSGWSEGRGLSGTKFP